MGILHSSSFLLGMLCIFTCSAIYLEDIQSSSQTLPKSMSNCKKSCNTAYHLCLDKLAKSKATRYQCIKVYLTTFPKCYLKVGKISRLDILESFVSCVGESIDIGENFACSNAMNFQLAKIEGAVADASLEKRSNIQMCNGCRNSYDVCALVAVSQTHHDVCIMNKNNCFNYHKCI